MTHGLFDAVRCRLTDMILVSSPAELEEGVSDTLRSLTRSPHPYVRQAFKLPRLADQPILHPSSLSASSPLPDFLGSPAASDSGTEADDEHFLRGLPAPRPHRHKGLRSRDDFPSSGTSARSTSARSLSLLPILDHFPYLARNASQSPTAVPIARCIRILLRRSTEASLLTVLAAIVVSNPDVRLLLVYWGPGLHLVLGAVAGLCVLYPLRFFSSTTFSPSLLLATVRRRGLAAGVRYAIGFVSPTFDPATLLYPPVITVLVSLLVAVGNPQVMLSSLVLAICSLPPGLVPNGLSSRHGCTLNIVHWLLSCLPLQLYPKADKDLAGVLIYPLHHYLCALLHHLTTTSILPAELQLLSVGLISLLLQASSPQAHMLRGLLWLACLCTILLSGQVIRWAIDLARVPKWRFRKAAAPCAKTRPSLPKAVRAAGYASPLTSALLTYFWPLSPFQHRYKSAGLSVHDDLLSYDSQYSADLPDDCVVIPARSSARTSTSSHAKPSGRRKRAVSAALRPFLKLTRQQAANRRWHYASHVYIAGFVTYIIGRLYLGYYALGGYDPILWVLGFLFGNLVWFRHAVSNAGLDSWIPLPRPPIGQPDDGWLQRIRLVDLGAANTRLILAAYWAVVMTIGFSIVFRLQHVLEVDTRRKGFHFIMVAACLPTIFVDPASVAAAFVISLALFLLIDLLRASQLPPFSRTIATFIGPYIDGRDLAGPVIVSPIFLLIGCAIPLWLTLARLPRAPSLGHDEDPGGLSGWEVPTRDVSMVAGVVCVGLGDAAASIIGRRFGFHKWPWGGSKSLEGSLAFAIAVFAGLTAARAWLDFGGWIITSGSHSPFSSLQRSAVCAALSSLTEAVLTGCNDNVVVPVILWTCVRGLEI